MNRLVGITSVNTKDLVKLDRLLKRFPEVWLHTQETETVDGVPRTFHHVDYKSGVSGKPRVRLVSHVSSDMCELLVDLKANAAELIAAARAATKIGKPPSKEGPKN
jgi:hypothetical protein